MNDEEKRSVIKLWREHLQRMENELESSKEFGRLRYYANFNTEDCAGDNWKYSKLGRITRWDDERNDVCLLVVKEIEEILNKKSCSLALYSNSNGQNSSGFDLCVMRDELVVTVDD